MTLIAIADDDSLIGHLTRPETGPVDVLISCGDLHDHAILKARDHYQPRYTVAVRGNHDGAGPYPDGIIDLHLRTHVIDGVTFGGFGGCWKYKPRGHHLYEQDEVTTALVKFPGVDVFVSHNSPAGIHELDQDVHKGFAGFLSYLDRAKSPLMIHGHQHRDQLTTRHGTTIMGVFGERIIRMQT
jgi:uncharacterized protein